MSALRVVIDTNVFVGALIGHAGHNRKVLRACLTDHVRPVMGQALFLEFQAVLSREHIFSRSPISAREREELLNAFLSVCDWVEIYYSWRPNLSDEGDNHVMELAVAGGVSAIVTNNVSDLRGGELVFNEIPVMTPIEFLQSLLGESSGGRKP
ncbi:MAG: putative toxin-antitoxin system toxin component, PIN family [Acidobacteriota bacterium]